MGKHSKRIAVITDSTCDIPPELIEEHQIVVVPLYLIWGTEELLDGCDIDAETFYTRLPSDPIHPKTSFPGPEAFVEAIQQSDASEAVIIVISSQLSGTVNSVLAARGLVDVPVHVVDSRSVSMGLGWQVLAAARARDQGGDAEAMVRAAHRVLEHSSTFVTVDTLEYLHRGGRIGGAAKLLGTALQLKPLLTLDEAGRIQPAENTRTRKKALRSIVEATLTRLDTDRPMRVAVTHGNTEDDARAVLEEILIHCQPVETIFAQATPIIGVHTGPGAIAICGHND